MTDAKSYKETIDLPQTTFSMRANAVQREPELQRFWGEQKIYERLSQENPGELLLSFITVAAFDIAESLDGIEEMDGYLFIDQEPGA